MHGPNPSSPEDEVLDRAIASLRDTQVPRGPIPLLQERTLASISEKQRSYRKWYLLYAAAAMLVLACSIPAALHAYRQAVELRRHAVEPRNQWVQERTVNTPAPPVHPAPQPSQHPKEVPSDSPRVVVASDVSITGHVYYRGPRPKRSRIDLASCPQCAEVVHGALYDDSLVVNQDGTLENVVVSISAGLPPGEQFPASQAPVMLDQKGCMFHPHVIATMVGQPIVVKNSDPFLHSVHSMDAELSPTFDFAQPTTGERRVEPLQVVETFQVKCDLHPWMSAWVRVFNHPYFAVTSADGRFGIRQLPPGKYRLKAWHELLGVQEKTVEVREGEPCTIDFMFDR
jgi:hypothetical protein